MTEILTNIRKWIPLELVDLIVGYLNRCQICFCHLTNDQVLKCNECKRSWCLDCHACPRLIKYTYHPSSGQKCYICAWCLKETKELL